MRVFRAIRELWEQSPVFLAVALSPIVFGITFAVLWWVIDDGAQPAPQVAASLERSDAAVELDREFDRALESGDAQVGLTAVTASPEAAAESSTGDSSPPSSAAGTTATAAGGAEARAAVPEGQRAAPVTPQQRDELPDLAAVSKTPLEPEKARFGGRGEAGQTLPIANGIVWSSGPGKQTSLELYIPKASLYADIVRVGRTPWGGLGAPDNPEVIGWYEDGAEPGSGGNALLVGHLDYTDIEGDTGPGVCYELNNVQIGDQMFVRDRETNIAYVYEIGTKAIVDPNDPKANRYLSSRNQPLLTLITCHGQFDREEFEYSQRLIIVGILQTRARA